MKNIIQEYRQKIMKDPLHIKQMLKGKLPVIKGFEKIADAINFYNAARKKQNWGIIFEKKRDQYQVGDILSTLTLIVEPAIKINNILQKEMNNYERNYKYFKKSMHKLEKEFKTSEDKDKIEENKTIDIHHTNDMSTGIFSPEEARRRSFFNKHINPYISEKAKKIKIEWNDMYDRYFAYFYMKFELINSLGLKMYPNTKLQIYWKDKLNAINKFPIGRKILTRDIKQIIDVANHYKHQTSIRTYPKINFFDKVLKSIASKISKNTNFSIYFENLKDLDSEIEGWYNPLGLTGFE